MIPDTDLSHHHTDSLRKNHLMNRKKYTPLAALAGLALAAGSAHGALLVYEGFNYTPASATNDPGSNQGTGSSIILTGNGGTTEVGLGGTWANAANDAHNMYLVEGSLSFGDLQTSGNHIRYRSNANSDRYNRGITASLSGGGEIWFSFLANRLQNNFDAGREGIAITNGTVSSAQFDNISATGLHGFGIAATGGSGSAWTAWGWNGTTAVSGAASLTVPTNGSQTNLLVGHIEYGAGTGGSDVFSFYNYLLNDGSVVDGTLDLVTSIEVDVDESLLNTLNVTRQVNTAYDEIRIGTTFDSVVLAIPEPSTALLGGIGMLFLLRRRR